MPLDKDPSEANDSHLQNKQIAVSNVTRQGIRRLTMIGFFRFR